MRIISCRNSIKGMKQGKDNEKVAGCFFKTIKGVVLFSLALCFYKCRCCVFSSLVIFSFEMSRMRGQEVQCKLNLFQLAKCLGMQLAECLEMQHLTQFCLSVCSVSLDPVKNWNRYGLGSVSWQSDTRSRNLHLKMSCKPEGD